MSIRMGLPVSVSETPDHRCWSRGNIVTSHAAGPGSNPDESISWLMFIRGFLLQLCKTIVRKFGPQSSSWGLILQPFRHFTNITAHSPTISVTSPTSQFILQPVPSLHQHHSSFSNPSVTSPTSQLILQPFRCFTYVTAHSPSLFRFSYITGSSLTSCSEPPMLGTIFSSTIFTGLKSLWWLDCKNVEITSWHSIPNCFRDSAGSR